MVQMSHYNSVGKIHITLYITQYINVTESAKTGTYYLQFRISNFMTLEDTQLSQLLSYRYVCKFTHWTVNDGRVVLL